MLTDMELIRRIPLFAVLTSAQAQRVVQVMNKQRYRRGEVIVHRGQPLDVLKVVMSGQAVVVCGDGKGREVIIDNFRSGDSMGESCLLENLPYAATVRALSPVDVIILEKREFLGCLNENAAMANLLLHDLLRRLHFANRRIESLALLNVYGRVARTLLLDAQENEQQQWIIAHKISRQTLAKTVGASREMVSRVMRELQNSGFIEPLDDGSTLVHPHRFTPE